MKATDAERKPPKALSGVIHTEDGLATNAILKMEHGRWVVTAAKSWPVSKKLTTVIELSNVSKGAVLGVHAEWHRGVSDSALELPASGANVSINPYLHTLETGIFLEAFSGGIKSLVADDSFLLTLPLAFGANPASSFLSVCSENDFAVLGVVIGQKLEAVFTFPCSDAAQTNAAAARVRRYWSHVLKRGDFPAQAFVWGSGWHDNNLDGLSYERLGLPQKISGGSAMRAAGVALAPLYSAPAFNLPRQHAFRARRRAMITLSIAVLLLAVIVTAVPFFLNAKAATQLAISEEIYNSRISKNKSLQELNNTAGELSESIFAVKNAYTQSTNWGRLLSLLREIQPEDLWLERLGSENIQGSENSVRIALGGWSKSETSVTEFISGLHGSEYVDNVSLTSIERDAKNQNICRFRIVCTMQLFKK